MWNPFSKKAVSKTIPFDYRPSMYFEKGILAKLEEQFKGEVEQKKVRFPKDLGEEHPFDFETIEKLYKKFGFFTAVVDKYVDFIVGPGFYIECKDERAKKLIDDFMTEVNFDTILRQWVKEALVKGNGFVEIGGSKNKSVEGLKILNANYMYVQRDKLGKIEGYNQFTGGFDKFRKEKIVPFKDYQIAHVPFNFIGDSAYGLGIGYSAMKLIDDWLSQSKSEHVLMDRKANAPLHAKFGYINGETKIIPKTEDVQAFGRDLETMNNKTNWVTDPLVEFKVVDFGPVGDKFTAVLEGDLNMLIYAFQIPAVLLGMANIAEGLARVQMEGFQRRIQSIQAEFEKIIEQKIFKRVLNASGLDVHVEFEWGTPSVMEVEGRMRIVSELVKSPTTSGSLKEILEDELINLLKLDKSKWEELKLEHEKDEEEEMNRINQRPQPIIPGQNAKFPQKVQPKAEQPKQPKPEEKINIQVINKPLIDEIRNDKNETLKVLLDEFKKRDEQHNQIITMMMDKLNAEKEKIAKEVEVKKEIKVEKPTPKQKLRPKTSLLPAFRITRKTEKIEKVEEPKVEEPKVMREKKNYEYEKECKHCIEKWGSISDIEEWLGFSYKKYLGEILNILGGYEFNEIKGVNEIELQAGYLTSKQIKQFKDIMEKGFKDGKGMIEMAKEVDKKLGLKDLYKMNDAGEIRTGASGLPILARSADKRSILLIRTEVTRLANLGAEKYYKDNGILKEKWVASYGDRTCPDCEALNGQIFTIGESRPDIPLHPMCRCALAPVVELI